jgi:pimeloyl-ACP methyl ester carboxylesterase
MGKNLQDSIQFITTPTLILWGEKDTWIPVSNAYHFNSEIKGSQLIIYKNAGHVPMEEIPSETLMASKNFLLKSK